MKTNQTPGIRHTKNSGRLKSGAFESSTRLTPQHLQPTLSELRKLRTKTSAAHNLSAENYSSLSKKRKAKRVKQCERFISFHLTAFQRAVCGHGTVTHFKAVSHCCYEGDAAVWGTARRNRWPLPCSPALVSQGASESSSLLYQECRFYNNINCRLTKNGVTAQTMSPGHCVRKVSASALTTPKFCFFVAGGHKTRGYEVKFALAELPQPTVHRWWGEHCGRTKDHGFEKFPFLISACLW